MVYVVFIVVVLIWLITIRYCVRSCGVVSSVLYEEKVIESLASNYDH